VVLKLCHLPSARTTSVSPAELLSGDLDKRLLECCVLCVELAHLVRRILIVFIVAK